MDTNLNGGESTPDVIVSFPGGEFSTLWGFAQQTDAALEWVEENMAEIPSFMGTERFFHADHRPARELALAMHHDGLLIHDEMGRAFRAA